MTKIISKIMLSVVVFLMSVFPSSGNLLIAYQNLTYPGFRAIGNDIIRAIETKDADIIVDMYSPEVKSRVENLPKDVEDLINSIEGEILKTDFWDGGGKYYAPRNGVCIQNTLVKIEIVTTKDKYLIYAGWNINNTEEPETVGLGQLTVFDSSFEIDTENGGRKFLAQVPPTRPKEPVETNS